MASRLTAPIALLFFFFPIITLSQVEFIFNGFANETGQSSSNNLIILEQDSIIKPSGALRLTNISRVIGHAFYSHPIQMFNSSLSQNISSFSTTFVFAIVPRTQGNGGYGLAFTVSPSPNFPGAENEHYLGIFNPSNDGNSTNHILAVEFDTVNGINENSDTEGNHVGININGIVRGQRETEVEQASYFNESGLKQDLFLESGKPIQAWIEYDGVEKVLNVTISPMEEKQKLPPNIPLLSRQVNLTHVFKEKMYVGFSSSTGAYATSHYILGWSFSLNGSVAPPLNLSQLPLDDLPAGELPLPPRPIEENSSSSSKVAIIQIIGPIAAAIVALLGLLVFFKWYKRMKHFEILEDWELDCPRRFRYGDLYTATKGFKESEVIGTGGFGVVYKGVLLINGSEVAIKKISRNSAQGMREFAAEIESLGRLRHKHLIHLQGWCKRKNDLLLIYDYIPNGSLDSLLFKTKNGFVLSWEQRFNIIKGIASGLLYLHEEWEQVVIHRDVKSSNVLIDGDMNAKLGDFGLARFYDHGAMSHTTNVVGTVGYIAPELARTGKASTSSDVFAYGVLLLEVATGRRPLDSGQFILVDWVLELQQLGQVLDVVDPKLGSGYVVEEMELVLGLGLLCSHNKQETRPTMRQVLRYLNGDDLLPIIDNWSDADSEPPVMNSRFLEIYSRDQMMKSSSIGNGVISSSSIQYGR